MTRLELAYAHLAAAVGLDAMIVTDRPDPEERAVNAQLRKWAAEHRKKAAELKRPARKRASR